MICSMKQAATVNLQEANEIVQYIRALLDFHDLWLNGWEKEWQKFSRSLLEEGWSQNRVNQFLAAASYNTHYEALIDSPIVEQKR